ncbi:Protein phosphatase 4 core regulatory subunit R2 [Penicillium brevicompactum]|uniref:Protein phosphatase 4 core regulatory subunit R2 n=1 Tax=Penicillium brevicompactum TaxID=5074 RepID=A0A9W9RSW8_PENBR|nr:Protein phosphatase 4 core regulatory subunit R2 [Penicillium brevicompactum]
MSLDEEALQTAANGGSIELERWSGMATAMTERLEHIVYNVFPMPQVRPEPLGLQSFLNASQENNTTPESSNKENDAPAHLGTASQAVEPGSPTAERVPDSQPQASSQSTDTLPPPLALLLNAIRSSIHSFFTDKPPHTIQRLAELILYPTKHYKTLPAYLRAVDRVTSVTSSADIFPFQTPASENAQTNGIAHPGKSSVYMAPDYLQGLGSDESLGGALLTPIPWLSNASFDGDDEELNGDANVLSETTEEPLPIQSEESTDSVAAPLPETEDGATTASPEPSDEVPHARGPIVLGVEDMGLQDGKGVEMSLGTDSTDDVPAAVAATPTSEEVTKTDSSLDKDGDGDIVLEDTKAKEEPKDEDAATNPTEEDSKSESMGQSSQAPDAKKET